MIAIKYLIKNRKQTWVTLFSITLMTTLMFTIGLLFSSFRNYLIQEAISEYGSQHVILTTSQTLKKTADIEKLKYQDGQYYITYIKPQKTYKITEQLCQKYSCQKIVYNDKLLSLYGASQNENLLTTLITLLVTILIILGLCVALIIYNSFAISLAKRQRDLAAFKSLGMSKRQIRHLLYFESFLILSLGIFIGFIFSFLLSGGLIYMINHLLSDIFISKLHLSIYPIFIVIPLIFMALITFSSAFIPALKASKVPIISSLRNSTTFTYKKLPHWAQKLSIPSKLAYQNYKRYKRKYRPVVICIVINTVLISTFSLYLSYSLKSIQDYSNIPPFDLQITTQGSYQPALTEFAQKENLTIYNLFDHCEFSANLSTSSYLNKEDYQEKINLLIAQSDQEGIINRLKMTKEQNGQLVKIDKAYLKDEVMLTLNENSLNFNTINKIPLGFDSLLENNVIFLTPDINHYCTNPSTTIFLQGKVANLKSKLTNLANEYHISGLEYVDINKVNHLTNNFILACKIVLYSLTGLIVLIGITSVLSTIWTSFELRKSEFATLKSLGITIKQIQSLLFKESLIIALKGLIYACPFIFLIDYTLYQNLNTLLQSDLIIPFKPVINCFGLSIIIIYLTMFIFYHKLAKGPLISALTKENL